MTTTPTYKNPWTELWTEFDELFNPKAKQSWDYNYNKETGHYEITIDLPGYDKSELSVEYVIDDYRYLEVTAKNSKRGEKNYKYKLYENMNLNSARSEFKSGVLTIVIPVLEDQKRGKKLIKIE